MKNKPLLLAAIYAAIYIAATLILYFTQRYEMFNMVYLMSMALLIPMVVLTIKLQRDGVYGGIISGREAAREGMRFVLFASMFLVAFQAIFYYTGWYEFKVDSLPGFIREQAMKLEAAGKRKFDEKELNIAIQEEIKNITLFKELTFVFFRCVFVGVFTSFITALFMKTSGKRERPVV